MRYTGNVLAFSSANGLQDLLDGFADYYNHHKTENMGKSVSFEKVDENGKELSFAKKGEILHSKIEEVVSKISGVKNVGFAAEVERNNPTYQWACYAVIGAMVDAVIADSVNDSFYRFAEVRNGGFGDTFSFDIKPNELFLTTKSGNGKRHVFAQRQFNGQATLVPENHMITVGEDLYRVLMDKGNLAAYALKVAMSMESDMADEIYNAINDTYSSLPAAFKEASYTQDTFISLCQRVKAFNGGTNVAVFGTQLALSKVLPTIGSGLEFGLNSGLGEEYTKTGYMGRVLGTDLFELRQKADWTSATYGLKLDDTRLYVVSTGQEKLVKVAIEGSTLSYADATTDNANLIQRQTMHKRWAVGLISNAHYGIIDIG